MSEVSVFSIDVTCAKIDIPKVTGTYGEFRIEQEGGDGESYLFQTTMPSKAAEWVVACRNARLGDADDTRTLVT